MASYAFRIEGIEPRHDPDWQSAPEGLRRAFWRYVVKLGLEAKDRELAAGLDCHGDPLRPIAASTRARRRSAMGPADPNAPPLTPAYGLSRTRSLLRGRAHDGYAEFYWAYDPHTGRSWGRILGYHRAGKGPLPVRDVIGISPASKSWVKARAWQAWSRIKIGLEYQTDRDALTLRSTAQPKAPPPKIAVVGRVDVDNASGWRPGEKAKVEASIRSGYFTGFRQFHPDGTTSAPGPAPPPPPRRSAPPAPPRPVVPKVPVPPRPIAPRSGPIPTPRPVSPPPPPPRRPAPPTPPPAPPRPTHPATIQSAIARAATHGVTVEPAGHATLQRILGPTKVQRTPAAFQASSGKIFINERHPYWQDPPKVMGPSYARGWFSSDHDEHIIVHELGHALHHRIDPTFYVGLRRQKLNPAAVPTIETEVSRYGTDSPHEFVAEVFAGLSAGKTYNRAVMAMYRQLKGPMP